MTEATVRDLMQQAMAEDEPPIGPVLGKALLAARRARRRRLAASVAAGAVIAACLVVGRLTIAGPGGSDVASAQYAFITPALPDITYVKVKPITNKYLGQLLVADLPQGAQHSRVEASVNSYIPGATSRTASVSLGAVTTSLGSGEVQANMMAVGATDAGFRCALGLAAGLCHAYSLAGGVKVVEEYASSTLATTRRDFLSLQIEVFRPTVAVVSLAESNRTAGARAVSLGMPLTVGQLLKAAVDPRWQFYITRSVAPAGAGRGMLM